MNIKITLSGPGGELDSIVLKNIEDETDVRITEAVCDMACASVWSVGDKLSIEEWTAPNRCPDCGDPGEIKGHMTCQYPED